MKIILLIVILICLGLGAFYLYSDNAPIIKSDFAQNVQTGGDLENRYLQWGDSDTSRMRIKVDSPAKKLTIFYPSQLENEDRTWPMILYVNGTGGKASRYEPLLEQMASWGFIVVGTQDKATGNGESTIQTLKDMISENENPKSIFYKKIDLENIGITGFSQGGAGLFNAITAFKESPYFKTAVAVSPASESTAAKLGYPYDISQVNCPVFLLSGTSGEFEQEFVIPFDQMLEMYNRMNVPKVMARRTGMTHDVMTSNAQGYVIAWMKWQLQNDREAARVFTGSSPELLSNDRYKDVKIDLDGMK